MDATERYASALSKSAEALSKTGKMTEQLADVMDDAGRVVRRLGADRESPELIDAAIAIERHAETTRTFVKLSPVVKKLIENLGKGGGSGTLSSELATFAFGRIADSVANDILDVAREHTYQVMRLLDDLADVLRGDPTAFSWITQVEDALGAAHGQVEAAAGELSDSMSDVAKAGDVDAAHEEDASVIIDLPDMGQALRCFSAWEGDTRVHVSYELELPSYRLTGSELSIVPLDERTIDFETVIQANAFDLDDYAEPNMPDIPADVERDWHLDDDLVALTEFANGGKCGRDLGGMVRAYDAQEGTDMTSYEGELAEYAKRAGWDIDVSTVGQEQLPIDWGE